MNHPKTLPFVLLASLIAACAAESTDEATGALSDAFSEGGTEAWGPALALRDDTTTFAGRPAGGWFVTPIHITLLPDGKLLTTGWGRAQVDRCQFPEGSRAHGETFVLDQCIEPVPWRLAVFAHDTWHHGAEVIAGTKVVVRGDVIVRPAKLDV